MAGFSHEIFLKINQNHRPPPRQAAFAYFIDIISAHARVEYTDSPHSRQLLENERKFITEKIMAHPLYAKWKKFKEEAKHISHNALKFSEIERLIKERYDTAGNEYAFIRSMVTAHYSTAIDLGHLLYRCQKHGVNLSKEEEELLDINKGLDYKRKGESLAWHDIVCDTDHISLPLIQGFIASPYGLESAPIKKMHEQEWHDNSVRLFLKEPPSRIKHSDPSEHISMVVDETANALGEVKDFAENHPQAFALTSQGLAQLIMRLEDKLFFFVVGNKRLPGLELPSSEVSKASKDIVENKVDYSINRKWDSENREASRITDSIMTVIQNKIAKYR